MNRPYVICHILSALDGKIAGSYMKTESNRKVSAEYVRIRQEMKTDAWLYGTTTTKEFTYFRKPECGTDTVTVPNGDYVAEDRADLYYISVDKNGEIGWESGTFHMKGRPDSHIIEVLTENTPIAYRAYLRGKGVSYILAGKEQLDCKMALEKLYTLFGIKKVLICGGGGINWTFVQAECVDELSLLLSPAADGSSDTPTVFEKMPYLNETAPVEFSLKSVERIAENGVHLLYEIKSLITNKRL